MRTGKPFMTIFVFCFFISTSLSILSQGHEPNPGTCDLAKRETDQVYLTSQKEDMNYLKIAGDHFTPNKGQISNTSILYYTDNAYFCSDRIILRASIPADVDSKTLYKSSNSISKNFGYDNPAGLNYIYQIVFEEANKIIPSGQDMPQSKENYFRGNDSSKWIQDVPNFYRIVYENLWNKIDLTFSAVSGGIKYEFYLHPGGKVDNIRLKYVGATIRTDGKTLFIDTPILTTADNSLYVYQKKDMNIPLGSEIAVDDNTVSYRIDYDNRYPLVIDPMIYSTSIGQGIGRSIITDSSGNACVAGDTYYPDFPTTPGAYDTTIDVYDMVIFKLNQNGSDLIFSTFIGGNSDELASDIALDESDNIYVSGTTSSTDFPTTSGAYDSTYNGNTDIVVVKLGPAGDSLLYSTYVGGAYTDGASSVSLDSSDNVYFCGQTSSPDFPTTPGAFDTAYDSTCDGFMAKLDLGSSRLLFSTFMGGSDEDNAVSMEVDNSSNAYVTGYTRSFDFPTTAGAFDTTFSGADILFVAKFNLSGSGLIFSTFIGGSNYEYVYDLRLDSSGNITIAGYTASDDFPTTAGALNTQMNGPGDGFVSKLSESGDALVFSTFIGGSSWDSVMALATDSAGDMILSGYTYSADFPHTPEAFDGTFHGKYDGFVSELDPSGSTVIYSTFLGGTNEDELYSVWVDGLDDSYVTGYTKSTDFPISGGAFNDSLKGASDLIVAKISHPGPPGAPRNLTGEGRDRQALLDWKAGAGDIALNYSIYRGTDAGSMSVLSVIGDATHYSDTKVSNGQSYYYAVAGMNSLGLGNRSEAIKVVVGRAPDAPTNLTAEAGDNRVVLGWNPPAYDGGLPLMGYKIYKGISQGSMGLYGGIGLNTSYEDTNVTNGVNYYYNVSAWNDKGESFSRTISTTPWTIPSAPLDLAASPGVDFVYLTWSPPASDGGFPVLRFELYSKKGVDDFQLLADVQAMEYSDTSVLPGTPYEYRVAAVTEMGSGENAEVSVRTLDAPSVPGLPVNLTVNRSGHGLALAWERPVSNGTMDIERYNVYRGGSQDFLSKIAEVVEPKYYDLDVVRGQTYFYAVSAINALGEGKKCLAVMSLFPQIEPMAPQNYSVVSNSGYVALKWEAPAEDGGSAVLFYRIYRGADKSSMRPYADVTETRFNDSDLSNGATIYYAVSAFNSIGESQMTEPLPAVPFGIGTVPGVVTITKIISKSGTVSLSWNPPADDGNLTILHYRIYRGISNNVIFLNATNSTGYQDSSASIGKLYYYGVSTVNQKGEGNLSNLVSVLHGNLPGAVQKLAFNRGNGLTISWNPPADTGGFQILQYNVYRGKKPDSMVLIGNTSGNKFIDKHEHADTIYYKVTAVNIIGEGTGAPVSVSGSQPQSMGGAQLYFAIGVALVILPIMIIVRWILMKRRTRIK
jgi:fibronectin type 3 domain-containing protein